MSSSIGSAAAPAPDLIGRDFTAEAPGQRLVGDIAYLPTDEGWLYLATTIDLHTREVVGHAMATHMRAQLVADAVTLAYRRGLVDPEAIFHSDRGPRAVPVLVATHRTPRNRRSRIPVNVD